MKFGTLDLIRIWAAITGIALAVAFFVVLYLGLKPGEMLPMLVAAIGGFEIFLFSQDIWLKRRGSRG